MTGAICLDGPQTRAVDALLIHVACRQSVQVECRAELRERPSFLASPLMALRCVRDKTAMKKLSHG